MEGGARRRVLALKEEAFVGKEAVGVKSESLSIVTEGAIVPTQRAPWMA